MEAIPQDIREKVQKTCAEYLGGAWEKVKSDNIVLEQITKGMCNMTFRCALPEEMKPLHDEPAQVLFKLVLNKFQRSTFAIMTENLTFALLAQKNLAPQLHGVFEDGRIEEFIPSRTLTADDLQNPKIKEALAKKIAHFHAFKAPVSKNPRSQTSWYATFRDAFSDIQTNSIFREGNDPETQKQIDSLLALPLQEELDWMRSHVYITKSPVVFSHTDLQLGNILIKTNPTDDLLQLVDFEYSGYNYRGYDFASTFLNQCIRYGLPDPPHFEADWNKFPSEEKQRDFVGMYVKEFQKVTGKLLDDEKEVDQILDEVTIFYLVQHYTFGLAGIFRFRETEFKIDWLLYANERFRKYFEHKKKFYNREREIKKS